MMIKKKKKKKKCKQIFRWFGIDPAVVYGIKGTYLFAFASQNL